MPGQISSKRMPITGRAKKTRKTWMSSGVPRTKPTYAAMTQRRRRTWLSAARPSVKPRMQARTPATRLICNVTSVPRASSGIAVSTMFQSIVTPRAPSLQVTGAPHQTSELANTESNETRCALDCSLPRVRGSPHPALPRKRGSPHPALPRERGREKNAQLKVGIDLLHIGNAAIDELGELGVLLAERVAVPIISADILHHGVDAGTVAHDDAQGRYGVEHAVDAALRQRQIRGRMIVVGLHVLEARAALRLELVLELDFQGFSRRAELDAEHAPRHVGDGLDLVLVGRADEQRLRGVRIRNAEQHALEPLLGVAHRGDHVEARRVE